MNFPQNLKYTNEHEWIRVDGDIAYVGITDYAQEQLGDIVFVDIPTVGETLEAGETFGTIEVVKTISDLFLPIAGEVLEQNEALEENPELVNKDPYGEGWLIKVKPADVKAVEDLLFEMNALSAHRTPEAVEEFAKNARNRGIKVIIAAAGMAAALPGVIAANTTLPVIGVPVKGSVLDGVDALYSIIQMPPGIPVATVAINGAMNAAILAIQMLALSDEKLAEAFAAYKEGLKKKIVKANEELKEVKFEYKTN